MIENAVVRQIVEEYIANKEGFFIVNVSVSRDNSIVVEIDNQEAMSIEECECLTRFIESKLNRDEEDYELEVGSPGLTSPFRVKEQYYKYEGAEVEVLGSDGKKYRGLLCDVTDDGFAVEETKMEKPEGAKRKVEMKVKTPFTYDNIKYTKYTIKFK
ncbi:MAG: ribosome assembly cofactor RimP [Paludibacteraceae bacterium]|nr:ribosome assembly cofactor RimP [Paludibacteraceae bacterium]MBR6043896.1 ribosome assembly cofactor RimP [Paludibacteraceae bacterium]